MILGTGLSVLWVAYATHNTLWFSDWFNGIDILQGRWQNGEKVGYCYPSGLEKTLCKWDIYVLLVTKGLNAELNPICRLLALLRAGHIFHVSELRVNIHGYVHRSMKQ
jgi:hypothetical protein